MKIDLIGSHDKTARKALKPEARNRLYALCCTSLCRVCGCAAGSRFSLNRSILVTACLERTQQNEKEGLAVVLAVAFDHRGSRRSCFCIDDEYGLVGHGCGG